MNVDYPNWRWVKKVCKEKYGHKKTLSNRHFDKATKLQTPYDYDSNIKNILRVVVHI